MASRNFLLVILIEDHSVAFGLVPPHDLLFARLKPPDMTVNSMAASVLPTIVLIGIHVVIKVLELEQLCTY